MGMYEYGVPVKESVKGDVSAMCNLGLGVLEEGFEMGVNHGINEGRAEMCYEMLKKGRLTVEEVAEELAISVEDVEKNISIKQA